MEKTDKKIIVVHDEKGKAVKVGKVDCPITGITEVKAAVEEKKPDLKIVPKKTDARPKAEIKPKPATLTFRRDTFQKDLSVAVDFVAKKDSIPVLTHVLFSSDGQGHCRIISTDMEVAWSKIIKCKGPKAARCVPASLLFKEVKALPDDVLEVVLDFKDNIVSVNGRCKIFTLSADDYPKYPEIKKWTDLQIDNFVRGLKRVSGAMSQDGTRYALNGVFLDLKLNRVVATDGHRLHFENVQFRGGKVDSLIIPRTAVGLMVKYPLTEIPKLTREKGKSKVGEAINKPASFDLDVFGHKVKVKYEPQTYKGTFYNANIEYGKGPISATSFQSEFVSAEEMKKHIIQYGSLKECIQALAENKYLSFNKTVFITVSDKYITYPVAGGEMIAKTVEGSFPNYTEIIPKGNPIKVSFSSSAFLQNMNGALPLNNESVLLKINSHLTIQTQSPDRGTYKWQIPCKTEGKDKGTVDIAFNARYLIEAIKSYDSQDVLLEIRKPDEKGDDKVFYPAIVNSKAVVMPMRA